MSRVTDIVHNITIRCPGFAEFWHEERRMHSDQDNHITVHGAFSVLSAFMDQHFKQLTEDQHRDFWEWIEWQTESSDEAISNAAVTCFLENIADTDVETHCRHFMSPGLTKWLDGFMNRGHRKKRWFEK